MERLGRGGISAQLLSSDELREQIFIESKYTIQEREVLYRAIAYLAKCLVGNGVNVIIDATGNRGSYREEVRRGVKDFIEVYARCPLDVCMDRERVRTERHGAPSSIYEKGLAGTSATVPGLGELYEEPLRPEVILRTHESTPEECAEAIYRAIRDRCGTGDSH